MKILIGVDSSEHSDEAVARVAGVKWPAGTEVVLVTVVRSGVFMVSDIFVSAADRIESLLQEEARQAEARLRNLSAGPAQTGLKVTTQVKRGDPRSELLDAVEEARADLVVVGSHGSGALKQVLLGSVALHVATNARCDVLVVKRQSPTS